MQESRTELPLVTVITPTGHREKAFDLCKKYLLRQNYPLKRIQWIPVIDDENNKYLPNYSPVEEDLLKLNQYDPLLSSLLWNSGFNTQRYNIDTSLPYIKGEYIFFFEDDDFYYPNYISEYVELLQNFDLVGEGNAKYYHLPSHTYSEMRNYEHTSLASLAFNKKILPTFKRALHSGEIFFDIKFWELAKEEGVKSLLFCNKNLSIGIKGLPGRPGIGIGHKPEGWTSDPFGKKLIEWVGEDHKLYKEFL